MLPCSVQYCIPCCHGKVDVPRRDMTKDGHHPRTSTRPREAVILDGAGEDLVGILPNTKTAHDSAIDTEGGAMEGQDKNRGGDAGTEEGGETALNAPSR